MKKFIICLSVLLTSTILFIGCTNKIEITIYFDSNGGSAVQSITTENNATISMPPNPTKEGFIFGGWYLDNYTFTIPFTVNSLLDMSLSDNMTVYAKWNTEEDYDPANEGKFRVTFEPRGGTAVQTQYVMPNSAIESPVSTREGYLLDGWYTSLNGITLDEKWSFLNNRVATNLTLFAKWTPITYTVVYDVNGGTGATMPATSHTYDVAKSLASNTYQKTNYTFSGWNTAADGSGTAYTNSQSVSNLSAIHESTVTLYAQWAANTYTMTYEANKPASASGEISGSTASSTHSYDTSKALNESLTLTGWSFTGWNTAADGSGTDYEGGEVVLNLTETNHDTIPLYAQWSANTYTVTYNSNGGSGATITATNHVYDTSKKLADNTYTKLPGYKFAGWNTKEDGTGTAYTDGQVVANLTAIDGATVILYAQWAANVYKIVYHPNKPSAASGTVSVTMADSVHECNETKALSANEYLLTGWSFINWNTEANGSGTFYSDAQNVTNLTNVDGAEIHLYAQWSANSYVVFYMYEGATGGNGEANKTVVYDSPFTLAVPTRTGYVFGGWFTAAGGGGTQVADKNGAGLTNWNVASNAILYVYWLGTQGLAYTLNGSTYSLSGMGTATDTDIIIPEYFSGKKVTSIGAMAFYHCSSLTSIIIPESVTIIGDYAFSGCASLTSITIPQGVTSIGDFAFSGCRSLTSVTILEGVTSIGSYAFSNCSSLTSITIPDSVTSIGYTAFVSCSSLTSITVGSANANYSSDTYGVLFDKNKTIILRYPAGNARTTYTIPGSVTSIGVFAFQGCSSLTSITIPEGVTSIGDSAFSYCSSVTSVIIPVGVTSIGNYVFRDCSSLTSVTIPGSVTSIGDWAFSGCTSLTIYVEAASKPNGWNSSWNFSDRPVVWNCLNNDVADDGYIYYGYNGIVYALKDGQAMVSGQPRNIISAEIAASVTYKETVYTVTSIDEYAFSNCISLTSVTIPDSVTSIGDYAFSGCNGLTIYAEAASKPNGWDSDWNDSRPVVWNCASNDVANDGYIYYGYNGVVYALKDGQAMVSGQPTNIISAEIAASVTYKETVYTVTSIGEYAFSNCTSLTSVTIPNSVTSIGKWAFRYCSSLTSVIIPVGVTSIGNYAFSYCTSLTSITVDSANANYSSDIYGVLFDKNKTTILCYPAGNARTTYTIPVGVTSIDEYAFSNCTSLTSVTIPDSVTSIGYYAFYYCTSLTIYVEAASKPSGWNSSWNFSNRPVVWGCTLSADKSYVVSVTKSASSISNPTATEGIKAPYREGYTFGGWATVQGGTAAYTAANVSAAPNGTTLYAIWIEV